MNQFYLGLLWASVGYLIEIVILGLEPTQAIAIGTAAAGLLLAWSGRDKLIAKLIAQSVLTHVYRVFRFLRREINACQTRHGY